MSQLLLASVAAALIAPALATVSVGRIFSDGMVLQDHATYDQRPFVFGSAAAGEVVTVVRQQPDGTNDTFVSPAAADGSWIVQVDPDYFAASQNNLTFFISGSESKRAIVIRNAAYGDVFLCSGQSNMNENVYASFGANETMAQTYPFMRLFSVAEGGAVTPQGDLPVYNRSDPNAAHWCTFNQWPVPDSKQECNVWQTADEPTVIGAFSAACFYAGLSLSQQLTGGRVLGLIHSSVSGTPMRQWAPPEALAACDAAPAAGGDVQAARAAAELSAAAAVAAPPRAFPPDNSTLFNAMINPISRFAIRGAWWDQGESDAGESEAYFSCLFQALIESWRRRWRIGDFAWVFAQLGAQDSGSWPTYWTVNGRAAQASALPGAGGTTDTTGMAVAYDIGDMGSPYPPAHVHSRRKAELGRRLALAMIHSQYALQWPSSNGAINLTATSLWSGPTPSVAPAAGGAFAVTFATLDGRGVYANETADAWETCSLTRDLFQVASGGGSFVNTTFTLVGAVATVTPVKPGSYDTVRYAANLWPQCAIYAVGNALPVAPFSLRVGAAAADFRRKEPAAPRLPAAVAFERVITPRVPGAWAGGWRGTALPPPAVDGVAATPPMGFNTWNSYHCNVDENILRRVADAFVSTGLASAGYTYVNGACGLKPFVGAPPTSLTFLSRTRIRSRRLLAGRQEPERHHHRRPDALPGRHVVGGELRPLERAQVRSQVHAQDRFLPTQSPA